MPDAQRGVGDRGDLVQQVPQVPPVQQPRLQRGQRALADHAVGPQGQRRPLRDFQDQPVTALAGIARPSVFFDMLRARGLTLTKTLALPDHAEQATYAALLQGCDGPILCTEKDAVKCKAFANEWHFSVPLSADLPAAFWVNLLDRVDKLRGPA